MMNRKQFIESVGATCKNWTWSWSFINEIEKVIIFGAWDTNASGNGTLIFSDEWEYSDKGRRQPAYDQSREHIRLIEEEGYTLKTFPIFYSNANKDENGIGPAKIDGFTTVLTEKFLKGIGGDWFAAEDEIGGTLPEELDNSQYIEGASKTILINAYERSEEAREKCIEHHGFKCSVCAFDFEKFYGPIGKNYIHVHHVVPLSEIRKEYILDPIKDLIPVCPNCHAIIHRTRPVLTIGQLKLHLSQKIGSAGRP